MIHFWKWCLVVSGYSSAAFLVLCLSLTPLAHHFPRLKPYVRYRRELGLISFYFAVMHVGSYFVKKVLKTGHFPWKVIWKPMVIPGEIAFLILFILALTSNRYSIKKLGGARWKSLHRFVYLAQLGVFSHMAIQGAEVWWWAIALFLPLIIVQRVHLAAELD